MNEKRIFDMPSMSRSMTAVLGNDTHMWMNSGNPTITVIWNENHSAEMETYA